MGFFDRAWKVATGIGGAAVAPAGLIKDLVFEALPGEQGDDDDYDGFLGAITGHSLKRAGQAVGSAFGPDSGVGAFAGGIPEALRNPVADAGGAVLDGLETAYREGVAEPITTAMTVASIGESKAGGSFFGGFGEFFNESTWRDAYKIAQDRSPGQAISLAFGTKDILDPNEVNEYVGTDMHKISSGLWDAAMRLTIDPANVAGAAVVASKAKYLTRPVRSLDQINDYFKGGRWAKVNEIIEDAPDSASVRDRLFKNHAQGDILSTHLKSAGNAADREKVMRFFMGDVNQLDNINATDRALGSRLQRLFEDQALIKQSVGAEGTLWADEFAIKNAPSRLDGIAAEIDDLTAQHSDARLRESFAAIPNELRATSDMAGRITRSGLYQTSPAFKPVRTFTNMRPHRVVDVHRAEASTMVDRQLREWGVSIERRNIWRSRIDEAQPEARFGLVIEAEQEAFRVKAKQYGLSTGEVKRIIRQSEANRGQAVAHIRQQFDPKTKRSQIQFDDPDGELIDYPLLLTQTANAVPLADAKAADRALQEAARFKWRMAKGGEPPAVWDKAAAQAVRGVHLTEEGLQSIMKVWKPAVLLRPAWTMRVVLMDEQLRQIAKLGAMATAFDKLSAGRNLTHATMKELFGDDIGKATRWGGGIGAGMGMVTAGPVGALAGGAIGAAGARAAAKLQPSAFRQLDINGYKVSAALGHPDDADEVYRSLASSADSQAEFLDVHEQGIFSRFKRGGGWTISRAGETPTYKQDWTRVVNRQILADPMARQFVDGKTVDDVVGWLSGTVDGVKYQKTLRLRRRDLNSWAETTKDMVDELVPDIGDLRSRAATRNLKYDDLAAHLDEADMPQVHAELVAQVLGRGVHTEMLSNTVQKLFRIFGTLPADHLSRNPYFARVYEAEMKRRLAFLPSGKSAARIDAATLAGIEKGAKDVALKEMRTLLYDMAERSEFADMMRNVMPFFPAYQEVLTRWAGLAVQEPDRVAKMLKVMQSPSKLPKDEESAPNILGFKPVWYTNSDGEANLQFRLPDWAKGLVNKGMLKSAIDSQGYVRVNPKAFSLVGNGTPGFGPFVQIAMSEVVKNQPQLEDAVKFILPYGASGEWIDVFLPAHVKRLQSLSGGDENRSYANAYYRIITTKLTEIRDGKAPMIDLDDPVARAKFLDEAKDETSKLTWVRWFASLTAPAPIAFDSPYAPYIDEYRKLKETDPSTADDKFLATYGEEFFALTQSFTKSNDGIPPTLKGLDIRDKFGDLITRFPELGGLIAGAEGSGMADKFSRAVYDRQLDSETSTGSGIPQRSRLSPTDVIIGPDTRLAWSKFTRAMDVIESVRIQRGLPNLKVKAAEDIQAAKQQFILELASDHPEWAKDYFTTDSRAWSRKIEGLTAIANEPQLSGRPAISGLKKYLDYRDQILDVLASRESKTLDAAANQDVAVAWDTIVSSLTSEPAFGELWARYLSNDPLIRDPLAKAV